MQRLSLKEVKNSSITEENGGALGRSRDACGREMVQQRAMKMVKCKIQTFETYSASSSGLAKARGAW